MKEGSLLGESCSSTKSDGDIVWYGLALQPPESVAPRNQTLGEEREISLVSRPSTAISIIEGDLSTLGSAPQRRTRGLKLQATQLKKEVDKLKEVLAYAF